MAIYGYYRTQETFCWKSNSLELAEVVDKTVAGAASEAFASWLHHRYATVKLLLGRGISFHRIDLLFQWMHRPTRVNYNNGQCIITC